MIEMVAHYEILSELGAGNTGTVYRARDMKSDRDVAVKILPSNFTFIPVYLQRFQREACAVSALNHANICAVYEIGTHVDRHFIAMELLDGQTLRAILQGTCLPADRIIHIAIQIADALKAAHAIGILHRDIKPENIIISPHGQVKIVDFELAKLAAAGRVSSEPARRTGSPQFSRIAAEYVSSPHATIGALPYMSPEQALGEDLDARSDLFSLGSVLYEMATGFSPFGGKTQPVLFQEILTKIPVPPLRMNPDLPPKLNDLICRLLEKDRELRHQTAADLCADLRRAKRDLDLMKPVSTGKTNPAARCEESLGDASRLPPARGNPSRGGEKYAAGILKVFRRPGWALFSSGALVLVLAIAAFFAFNRPSYFPFIAFDDFEGGSQSVDAHMVGFALKRTLSQFPEVAVLDGPEFNNLLAMEKTRMDSARSKASLPWLQRITPWRKEKLEPAIRVTGRVTDSLGRLEVKLECTVRGEAESLVKLFRGVDDLMNQGIDGMVFDLLNSYDPSIAESHIRSREQNYRTAVQLLSARWDAVRYYYRGARAWQRRDIYTAERELQSALEIDPGLSLAHLMLGEMRVWQNQWDAAQKDILAARAKSDSLLDVDQLRVEALLARSFSAPFKERDYLHRLIGLQPYNGEYLYELAESYFHTADVDEAIARYLDAVKLDRQNALSYNHLAYSYAWKGEHAQALEACKKYLELHQSANAYDSIGEIYMLAGDYIRAEQMKEKAIRMDPQIYYAGRNLAFIEMLRGRNNAALYRLRTLLASTEDIVQRKQFYAALAFLDYRKGDLETAMQMCRQGMNLLGAVRYEAPHDELIWIMGMIELRRHNLAGARRELDRLRNILDTNAINAMNYKPAYKYWLHLLAWIQAEEGRHQESENAINDLKWIRSKLGYWNKPYDRAFFFDAIGQIYETMDRPAEAEQAYREGLEYNPHFALSRFHLARLLKQNNRPADARAEMDAFWGEWQGADPDAVETIEAKKIEASLRSAPAPK